MESSTRKHAVRRLLQSEHMMNKQPELKREYNKCIQEYIDLEHMELSTKQGKNDTQGFFMAHHAVIKKSSSTTKVRPVFDASGKDEHGLSLNNTLLVGPPLQPKLHAVLSKWRSHKFVFSTDIMKMYRQILVDDDDAPYQQIVWRKSDTEPFLNFTLKRLTFGTANAAYQSVRCIQQLIVDEGAAFPDITNTLMKCGYIDDFYMGKNTAEELIKLKNDLIEFFLKGRFELRKWATNCNELLRSIPEANREIDSKTLNEDDVMRTLGIMWYPHTDCFAFNVSFDIKENRCTKRKFLSEISKI